MKYNSKENVQQVLTALTVKRLSAYARLCELYSKLADIMVNDEGRAQVTPRDIEQRYSAILSSVAYNDLDESSYNKILEAGYFSPKEVGIFKSFSAVSKDFIDFTNGYNILKKSVSAREDDVDDEVVADYLDFMQNLAQNKHAENFVEYIHVHSPIIIGKNYYNVYRRSLDRIKAIDGSHLNIPQFNSGSQIAKELFGPNTVKLSRTHRLRNTGDDEISIDDPLKGQKEHLYSLEEVRKYRREITPVEKLKDHAYSSGVVISDAIQETTLPVRILVGGVAAAILLGGAAYAIHSNLSSRLTATDAYRQGIELDISDGTANHLQSIEDTLQELSESSTAPTVEQLTSLNENLDLANSWVAQDLTAAGFEEAHPGCKVTNVTTAYQDFSAGERDIDIVITYLDDKGAEHTIEVDDIDTDYLQSFNREDSYATHMKEELDLLSRQTKNPNADQKVTDDHAWEILNKLKTHFKNLNIFAAMDPEYKDSGFMHGSEVSAKKRDTTNTTPESPTQDDDEKGL